MSGVETRVEVMKLDATQQAILGFDSSRHATILGAAGTGKTQTIVELIARETQAQHSDALEKQHSVVLVHNRRSGMKLRKRIETRVSEPLQGSVVRTPTALAFWIVAKFAAEHGQPTPRLITGHMQDDAIAEAMTQASTGLFGVELGESQTFRAEIRNLWRICDDYNMSFEQLETFARQHIAKSNLGELPGMWVAAARVLSNAAVRLSDKNYFTASGVLRAARSLIQDSEDRELRFMPSRLIIDDAQDLTEGALGLVAECASRGIAVWSFGDPDLATVAFQGERTELVTSVSASISRKLGRQQLADEQRAVLPLVHRGNNELRALARTVSSAIGTASAGQQRSARARAETPGEGYIEAVQFTHRSEMVGAIAHRLRETKLGVHGEAPTPWSEMAILCRSRLEAELLSSELTFKDVPTKLVGGGMVLREHRIIRDLVALLELVFTGRTPTPTEFLKFLTGPLGGLDNVEVRRLRTAILLQERKNAHELDRAARRCDDVIAEYLQTVPESSLIDSASGRKLHRLVNDFSAAKRMHSEGAIAREIVWTFWHGAGLAHKLQEAALTSPKQAVRAEANQTLDAVLAFMFVLERSEDSAQEILTLLAEILTSDVPEDTLAATSSDDAVVISTPQGVIGREYELVILAELQDGRWPNLRPRGSMLGLTALERLLRGEELLTTERIDTLHDELRLLVHAMTRSTGKLFAVGLENSEQFKSSFWQYFSNYEVEQVPTSGLTLRGMVAVLRRGLEANPDNTELARQLALLARYNVPGAHPDDWFGVRELTTNDPLIDLSDPNSQIRVSPSNMSRAETCPLSWALDKLGGPSLATVSSGLGTLIHAAFEQADDADNDPESMKRFIREHWQKLPFSAEWEAERQEQITEQMVNAVVDYVAKQHSDSWVTAGQEVSFSFTVGRAKVAGKIDRIETRHVGGADVVRVVDLKSGKNALSVADAEQDAQLMAYQYALESGEITLDDPVRNKHANLDGAGLLYVHPDQATTKLTYRVRTQPPMDESMKQEFEDRVVKVADSMVGPTFTAQVEHHCTDDQGGIKNCALHIIPAVSFE